MRPAPAESHGGRSISVPVKPGPSPGFPAGSRGAADPSGVSAADPVPFAFKGTAPRPGLARVSRPLSLLVPEPALPCAGLGARPGDGWRRQRESVPPSFLFRPSCDRDSVKGQGWPAARRWRWPRGWMSWAPRASSRTAAAARG